MILCVKNLSLEINVSKPKTRILDGPKLKFNITLFLRKARDNIDEVWHVISLTNTCTCKPYDKTINYESKRGGDKGI